MFLKFSPLLILLFNLVSSTRGAVNSAYSGTNRRTKLSVPNEERNSLIFFGSGNSLDSNGFYTVITNSDTTFRYDMS